MFFFKKTKYLRYAMPLFVKLKADKNQNSTLVLYPLSYPAKAGIGLEPITTRLKDEVTVLYNAAFGKEDKNYNRFGFPHPPTICRRQDSNLFTSYEVPVIYNTSLGGK